MIWSVISCLKACTESAKSNSLGIKLCLHYKVRSFLVLNVCQVEILSGIHKFLERILSELAELCTTLVWPLNPLWPNNCMKVLWRILLQFLSYFQIQRSFVLAKYESNHCSCKSYKYFAHSMMKTTRVL